MRKQLADEETQDGQRTWLAAGIQSCQELVDRLWTSRTWEPIVDWLAAICQAAGHRAEVGRAADVTFCSPATARARIDLAEALRAVVETVHPCRECFNLTEGAVCRSVPTRRDRR